MDKKKLSLGKLKVQSFVTDSEQENTETIKGGGASAWCAPTQMPTAGMCSILCAYTQVSCYHYCDEQKPF